MKDSFWGKHMSKLLLYSGLSLLLVALVIRWLGASASLWISVFVLGIALKAAFLVVTFRARQFKWSLWLRLILIGVVLIFVSLVFRYVYPMPLIRDILFYGAIALKLSGLVLLFVEKAVLSKRNKREGEEG